MIFGNIRQLSIIKELFQSFTSLAPHVRYQFWQVLAHQGSPEREKENWKAVKAIEKVLIS